MSPRERFLRIRQARPAILPSLLLCDFGNLEREVETLEAANVPGLHLDVMDGNFVPNLTYGMPIVAALRKLTELPLDVHLMITQPERYINQFVDAGSDSITIHVEAVDDPRSALRDIRKQGVAAGLALNPGTSLESVNDCLDLCDLVLVMSVNAGFGGQKFDPVALEKLAALRKQMGEETLLEVDGGINGETIQNCAAAGAELFVVGSAIFKTDNYGSAVSQLRELASATHQDSQIDC
jgi:ribulose-phosphate 3-epimerase